MRGVGKSALAWALVLLLAVGVAACGGGDDSSGNDVSTQEIASQQTQPKESGDKGTAAKPKQPRQGNSKAPAGDAGSSQPSSSGGATSDSGGQDRSTAPPSSGSGEGASAFRKSGGDNKVQGFGAEADASEREAAATALLSYLVARAEEKWDQACGHMSTEIQQQLNQLASSSKEFSGCPELLRALSENLKPSAKSSLTTAEVGSLRVEGDSGYALYHGAEGVDYYMPMVKEGGSWKVASLAGSPIS